MRTLEKKSCDVARITTSNWRPKGGGGVAVSAHYVAKAVELGHGNLPDASNLVYLGRSPEMK